MGGIGGGMGAGGRGLMRGPMSAPNSLKPHGGKQPHGPLRAQPPSWAGSNWNPRAVQSTPSSGG